MQKVKTLGIVGLIVAGLAASYCLATGVPYMLAMHEDAACVSPRGAMRPAIEECLYLYVASPCMARDRVGNADYDTGSCVSYKILGVEPIHVIYDEHGRMINRIPAYE